MPPSVGHPVVSHCYGGSGHKCSRSFHFSDVVFPYLGSSQSACWVLSTPQNCQTSGLGIGTCLVVPRLYTSFNYGRSAGGSSPSVSRAVLLQPPFEISVMWVQTHRSRAICVTISDLIIVRQYQSLFSSRAGRPRSPVGHFQYTHTMPRRNTIMVNPTEQAKLREAKEIAYGDVEGYVPDGAVVALLAEQFINSHR